MDPRSRAPEPVQPSDCHAVMAAGLRRIQAGLMASTATVYLLTAEGGRLAAAMTLDTPLSFTLSPGMATDDLRFTTAAAYHDSELVVMGPEVIRKLLQEDPAVIQNMPFPMLVASAPLRTSRHRFGAVTVRWVPPLDIPPERWEYLTSIADGLAGELESWADRGASLEAPPVPVFVPGSYATPPFMPADSATPVLDEDGRPLSGSSTELYQLQRLATALTAAAVTRDVVAMTLEHVVRPLGGNAVMLCLAEGGRLRVAGSAGFAKEELRRVDGVLLASGTPETDTAVHVKPIYFGTAEELRAAYPDLDGYGEGQSRAYFPLIANGRTVGCCVMGSDQPRLLRYDEVGVLTIMLGQVAQSLERARTFELQYGLSQTTQRSLLPRRLPHLAEIVTTARYLPATVGAQVGGDWYDVISLPGGGIALVIGDVEGHNLEAVAIMGQLRSGVRAYATEGHDPASVLTRSNRLLVGLETDLFATCCCMWLDLETGVATIASAGHHPPIVTDTEGRTITVQPAVGPPLGVDPDAVYDQTETVLPPGSAAALFTDGLLDARRLGADAGVDRLRSRLDEGRGENLEILADRLVGDPELQARRDDDIALLLARYEGTPAGTPERVAHMSIQRHDLPQVRRVRHFLGEVVRGWGIGCVLDELELLASEVVTNALIHAHSEVDVRLRERSSDRRGVPRTGASIP